MSMRDLILRLAVIALVGLAICAVAFLSAEIAHFFLGGTGRT
jgi:hypothetical protein